MKKNLIKTLGAALILLLQVACVEREIKSNLEVGTINYTSKEGKPYRYDLKIPQLENEKGEDISYFNVTMKEEARYIMENLTTDKKDGKIIEATVSYENHENSFDVLSLSILTSIYTGGAHNINNLESYNFSLKDETILSIDKILTEDGIEYFNARINDMIANKEKVLNTYGREVIFFDKVEADIRNSVITFEKDQLVFTFQNYDLSPYSSGMPVFKFNKKDVKKYLNM